MSNKGSQVIELNIIIGVRFSNWKIRKNKSKSGGNKLSENRFVNGFLSSCPQ